MKKLTTILLLLSGMLFLISCGSNTNPSRATKAEVDSKKDLTAQGVIRNALADLGLEFDSDEKNVSSLHAEDNSSSGNVVNKDRFKPVPIGMFLLRDDEYDEFDKYVDNYYYCYGVVVEGAIYESLDDFVLVALMTDYDNSGWVLHIVVTDKDEKVGWSDLKEEFEVFLYFKFAGYSNELRSPFGTFEYYERYEST